MKITYIISEIDKAVYFENTALALKATNYNVNFILINSENGSFYQFLKSNHFEVINILCNKISDSWNAIKACKNLLLEQKPDVIHCHLALANWVGLWAGKLAGIRKRIYTRHSGELLKSNWKENIIDCIQNMLATKVVAISKVVQQLINDQGVPLKKIALIHHGFDLTKFNSADKTETDRIRSAYNPSQQYPVIGVISRWLELKGIQFTIEAFRNLLHDYPDALLCLFGPGKSADFESEIQAQLKTLPDKNYRVVKFEKNIFALYSLFDVYVHVPVNARCEAFGQTYIESLAAGCPAVITLSGVAPEFIINEHNALVVPFKDAAAIRNQIERILKDEKLRVSITENGKKSISQFSMQNHIEQLQVLYSS